MKLYLIAILIMLTSCGSRKTEIQRVNTKKDSTVIITSNVVKTGKTEKKDSTNINLDITEDELTFTPIDIAKEIVIDGKSYRNVVLKIKKTKDNSIYKNSNTVSETSHIDSTGTTSIKETNESDTKIKSIEKTTLSNWLFWLVISITVVYACWVNKFWPFK
jgi:hypothetical protein